MPEPRLPIENLKSYVQWFDGAFAPAFCAKMIDSFEQMRVAQNPNGRGYRAGLEHSSWIEMNLTPLADAPFKGLFLSEIEKYLAIYNERLKLTLPVPERPTTDNLVMKRYRAGTDDNFEPHYDSHSEKSNRYLVFLWYLNDVHEGGETEFCDLGVKVAARVGRLLVFPPYWMFQHAGLTPRSNDKYIVSTYLTF
ncbi:MAG TPA: 2OG-Fe(II) oxygenase [Rudaea sp.]|nr:2OG-Fe(II) oxygenase [Rudaea sp.]